MSDANSLFPLRMLEWLTSVVLVLVVVSLAWMMGAAYARPWLRLDSPETEVIVMVVLLSGALCLVSLAALLQTRPKRPDNS
jgi:hypothetical protein